MIARKIGLSAVGHFLHRNMLGLIVVSYAFAYSCPTPGLWIKEAMVGWTVAGHGRIALSLPPLLLSFLLFSAGLRVHGERVKHIFRSPAPILAGLAANVAIPVAFILMLIPVLRGWHSADEAGTIVVGLALVAAMPVAGSSTGWAQNSGGDMALSLGLVLASTLFSPVTTPAALRILGAVSPAGYGEELHRLAGGDTGAFLTMWVLLPSLVGIAVRFLLGETRAAAAERWTKPLGSVTLLVLCYANASACLPHALGTPDWDFLAITLGVVMGLCVLTFASGQLLGRLLGADREQRTALMFGIGMSNNGTGLVLASVALASRPLVMLPIIAYNLIQHLVAGGVHALLRRSNVA